MNSIEVFVLAYICFTCGLSLGGNAIMRRIALSIPRIARVKTRRKILLEMVMAPVEIPYHLFNPR